MSQERGPDRSIDRWWALARLACALLILAAVLAQLRVTVGGAADAGRDVATTAVNFVSFFTILSNVAAMVVLAIAAIATLTGRGTSAGIGIALACVSTYMIVTGIVYNLLLRSVELPQGTTVAWSNEVVHVVAPAFLLIDVALGIALVPLAWRALRWVVSWPILWVVYTLIRGPLVTNPVTGAHWWYPYPFLDPNVTAGGYLGVTGYIAGIAVAITLVAVLVVRRTRALAGEPR